MDFVEFLKNKRGIQTPLSDKYGEWLGYEIVDFEEANGIVRTRLPIRQDHLSPSGAVHGGVISGFLDFSCGCAVFGTLAPKELCSTVNLNVKYFYPVRDGDIVIAESKVIHRGRSLSSVSAELFREKDRGKILAMATGTFNIYKLKE